MKKKLLAFLMTALVCFTALVACDRSGVSQNGSDESGDSATIVQNVNVSLYVVDAKTRSQSAGQDPYSIKETIKAVGPSVVSIEASFSAQAETQTNNASGVVIAVWDAETASGEISGAEGPISFIATCYHVVQNATEIVVKDHQGKEYLARPVGADDQTNVCVIRVDAALEPVTMFVDDDELMVGEDVLAFGDPLKTMGGSVTKGIVSAINRDMIINKNYMDVYQTDAVISAGYSGGGIFTADGYFLGITDQTIGNIFDNTVETLAFVTPAKTVKDICQKLMETYTGDSLGYIEGRYYLGCMVRNKRTGAWQITDYVVISVSDPKGSCYKGGLRVGDQIVSVEYNNEETVVTDAIKFGNYLDSLALSVNDSIIFNIKRNDRTFKYQIKILQYVCGAE